MNNQLEQSDEKINVKEKQICSNAETETNKTKSLHDEKTNVFYLFWLSAENTRNKACPCGSKKKYKSCCGTTAGRPATVTNDISVEYGKQRKDDKKQGRKGGNMVFCIVVMEVLLWTYGCLTITIYRALFLHSSVDCQPYLYFNLTTTTLMELYLPLMGTCFSC